MILLGLLSFQDCQGQTEKTSKIEKISNVKSRDQVIYKLIASLKKDMEDFMNMNNTAYFQNDVDKCISVLSHCTLDVAKAKSKDETMNVVKTSILELNNLNKKCEYSLIETNEREKIVEIIMTAVSEAGYGSIDEDITEEWREW